ncbi:MAG: type I DNA topoisomerase [Candidatus Harrisonbacteria bacterium]|nr:type I DNA topoisomerase [Candidatus Harrisonbacteria bacterium]
MQLVIVESPTKAKTISKFLGKGYKIESSYGHIRDLPKSTLGIEVEKNFEPKYIVPVKSKKVVKQLKADAQKSDSVILATDEDREGEAIAWHLKELLGLDKAKRIVFHEITQSAIENALKNPRTIDEHLVDAQQARRILDRLVGYKLSPFLWKKIVRGLSAGRVQSVALRLIVEREQEIRNFKPEEYWTITAVLNKSGMSFEANLVSIDGKTLDKFEIKTEDDAKKITKELEKEKFQIASIEKKIVQRNPLAPFITSTLQQEAAKRLGFSAKKTMFLSQRLYENGHITYMRTDSVNLSKESVAAAQDWLTKELGSDYALSAPRVFKGKSKLAQEAHEAIRPTNVFTAPEGIKVEEEAERKLYKLIWQRFVASQMPPAKISTTALEVEAGKYGLRASGQEIVFDGYLKIWPQKFSTKELPSVEKGDVPEVEVIRPDQHFTEPPPRFSEASLIKILEEYGIGRPSTYAPIISVIQSRNYVIKEGGKFVPTPMGELVNKVLTEHFPTIVDVEFTAKMEEELDEVAAGKEKWQKVIGDFYVPFSKNLEEKYGEVSKKELLPEETTDEKCEKCGKPMVIKYGRFGKFMACSGFPECKTTKQLPKEPPKSIGLKCEKCGEGEIVERRVTRGRAKGKIFWGCGRYPKCDYASWTDPRNPAPEASKEKDSQPSE